MENQNPDLIEPRGLLGREVEGDAVTGIAQECLACRHRLEDAGYPLPEIVVDAAEISDKAGQSLGHVGVEIVADDLLSRRRRRIK